MSLPSTDVAACYRDHARSIATGETPRPAFAVLFEMGPDGMSVVAFGDGSSDPRQRIVMLTEAIGCLTYDIQSCNAQASN